MTRLRSTVIFLAGFLVFFGGGVYYQSIIRDRLRQEPDTFHDWLYVPSSQYVKITSVGYDHFAANFLWLRAIQVFGASYAHGENLAQLTNYFNVITDLDPHFIPAYSFGNLVLGEQGKQYEEALKLMDKGIEYNEGNYRIAFEAAFFSYWTMEDPKRAKHYVAIATRQPDCPDFVRGWTAYFDLKMGRYIAAFQNYMGDLARFSNQNNPDLIEIRRRSIKNVINDWYKVELRNKALEFQAKQGRYPSVSELAASGALRDIEWPDWNMLDAELERIADAGEKIPEEYKSVQDFSKKFVHKGWIAMPANPLATEPNLSGYVIWPGQKPTVQLKGFDKPQDNRYFCMSDAEAIGLIRDRLLEVAIQMINYKKKNNDQCPPSLETLYPKPFTNEFAEPWGGKWVWDTERCRFYPSTHPEYYAAPFETPPAGPPVGPVQQ